MERWVASNGLCLMNKYGAYTCIRPQGSSIVDLTFVSHVIIDCIGNWRIREDLESLSDHLYINFEIIQANNKKKNPDPSHNRRWNFRKMDVELFVSSLEFAATVQLSEYLFQSAESYSKWILKIMRFLQCFNSYGVM